MRRVIRWVDPEGYLSVAVEHPRDGEFSVLRGLEDPMRLLQGESFPLGTKIVPVDEFSLDIRLSYTGEALEFPESRPSDQEIIETEDGARRLAGFLLRKNADSIRAENRAGRIQVLFHFDH